ncbi:MAG TPA: carboxylesterase family protein, partial [Alphaproteobacteria bacterium]|nr:carboxylesterase family protein [Alphaproteobacteria bacterium]
YGGGFWSGSASVSFTQGDNLARHGVMVVEPNYRVGPFGFLALAELSRESGKGSGAYGMMDAIAALKWVKANAAGFGGDPTRITLFGVSAGSLMVSAFTASPAARGLFTQVIGQSNGLFSPQPRSVAPLPLAQAEAAGADYAAKLGAHSLADLRKLPADELLKPQMRWWAVIDGDVLSEEPYDTFAAGRQADVPTLTGGNATEGVFISPNPPIKAADWAAELKNNWGADAKALRQLYPFKTDAEAYWSRTMVAGEVNYTWQVWTWAHLQAKTGKAPVWMWRFEQPYPARDPKIAALMGTPHGAELYYIFQHYPRPDLFAWTDDERKLGEVMAGYWTNFAKTGDPNGPGLPIWPRYALDKSQIIRLKTNPEVGPHPRKTELEFIDSVLAKTRAARSAPAPLVWWI